MRTLLIFSILLCLSLPAVTLAQSGQSPTIDQSTSTVDTRQANPPQPKLKKASRRDRMQMQQGMDTTLPKNRPNRRLRPDSLRRGGATRVDTIRR